MFIDQKSYIHEYVITLPGRVGVAVLSNQIYAIGGYDGLANLSSVEVYNPETEEWKPAPPLMRHQGGVVVAVIPSE